MKIVIIVYLASWLFLLFAKLQDFYQKKYHPSKYDKIAKYFEKKDPWYLYVAIIVLAPISVLLLSYTEIKRYIWNKKHTDVPWERARKMRNKANLTRYYLVNPYEALKQFFDESGLRYVVDESDGSIFFKYYYDTCTSRLIILRKHHYKYMLFFDIVHHVEIEAEDELKAHQIINDFNCTETFVKAYLIDNDLVFSYELFVHGIVLHDNEFLHTIMKLLIPFSDNFFNEEEVRNLFHFIWEYYDVVDIRDIDLSQYPKSRKKY